MEGLYSESFVHWFDRGRSIPRGAESISLLARSGTNIGISQQFNLSDR
jgi:hypothetical protein